VAAIKLKRIPAGTFLMVSPEERAGAPPDEKPQHCVRVTKPYFLGVSEVMQAQYRSVTGRNPSWFSSRGGGKELVSGA
jgi:formylglycine-generating enzyme required for sulfatase activity